MWTDSATQLKKAERTKKILITMTKSFAEKCYFVAIDGSRGQDPRMQTMTLKKQEANIKTERREHTRTPTRDELRLKGESKKAFRGCPSQSTSRRSDAPSRISSFCFQARKWTSRSCHVDSEQTGEQKEMRLSLNRKETRATG